MVARAGLRATINSVVYPITDWETVERGRVMKEEWTQGLAGGMGEFLRQSADGYYFALNMDAGHSPYIRLRPAFLNSLTGVTNLNELAATYTFVATDGSTNYIFLLAGQYGFKLSITGGTLHSTKDFGAGAACGRPALFEGKWYIPLGPTVEAVELTTIAVGAAADTYTSMGSSLFALAFATDMKEGTARLARAHTLNLIDFATDISATPAATDWAADDFEVGDTSTTITDLIEWNGELAVIKQDNVYAFDQNGNAFAIQNFLQRSTTLGSGFSFVGVLGAKSEAYGPYLYWTHPMGLWRIVGQQGQPIHPAAPLDFTVATRDSVKPWSVTAFYSAIGGVTVYGRYLYYAYEDKVYYGYIQNDGSVLWHGIFYDASTAVTVNIILDPVTVGSAGPRLIMTELTDTIRTIQLAQDGSPHTEIGQGSDRGAASSTFRFLFPTVDFGEPQKQKQLRKMWGKFEDLAAASPVQMIASLDRNETTADVGATITADGMTERAWTPGSSDLAYDVMPGFEIVTTAGYSPTDTDPRCVAFGIEAATKSTIRARISVTKEGLAETGQTITTVQQALRNLMNGVGVTITEPAVGPSVGDSFTGWVVWVGETAVQTDKQQGGGWDMDVFIERFDVGS